MIKSITVTNHLGESIKLELAFPEKSGFAVQRIDGLGPSKANINSTELANSDGSLFTSSKVTSRNIIMNLKFLNNPTIEDMRQLSYKYFPIKKGVFVLVEMDNRTCITYGYVESNEPDIFSKDEDTQISIICPDPYFYSLATNVTVFSGTEALFESEFSNESLIDDLIEFGAIKNDTFQSIYYPGDAEIGFVISIHFLGSAENIAIYNTETNESMVITKEFLASDDVIISTIKGAKSITLLRGGIYTNILNCLDKDSDWFQLSKGENLFAYTAEVGVTNLEFRIENQIVYEGA